MDVESGDDLIVARATAPGTGALAIVRVDGDGVAALVERLFRPSAARAPMSDPRRVIHGRWIDPHSPGDSQDSIDEGMTVFFAAPHSYTGNDLAEFYLHGGAVPVRRLIEAALASGARLAEPGEFTRRAFLNGKIDLAQAEAVADLINAQTDAAARLAAGQLMGGMSRRVADVREGLLVLAAEIEARIDFPEDEIPAEDRARLDTMFGAALDAVGDLLATRRHGRLVREGARVAIVGRANAGKSSLLNALAHMERAIVAPHPGTTRDTIECTIDLAGVPLTLVDTAGLRHSDDPVERLGIERTRREIERADLVLLVLEPGAFAPPDAARDSPFDEICAELHRPPDLIVVNKADLLPPDDRSGTGGVSALRISARRGDGLAALEKAIVAWLENHDSGSAAAPTPLPASLAATIDARAGLAPGESPDLGLAVNIRQGSLLGRAGLALEAARRAFRDGVSGELVMVDVREALDALGDVLGARQGAPTAEAILDHIFGRFCIGK